MRENRPAALVPSLGTPECSRPAMVRTGGGSDALTDAQKALILDGLRSGQSLASLLRDNEGLPGARVIFDARRADAAFGRAYSDARIDGLEIVVEEALDFAHAARGNKELSLAAGKYVSSVTAMANLLAPQRFGSMMRLAGADGEKLSVALVSYAAQEAQALEAEATPALPVR